MIDEIRSKAELLKKDLISFTQKLIQTPSLSGNEDHLAQVIVCELQRLKYDEVFVDEAGNVIGIMYANNNSKNNSCIMFSSHMDHGEPEERSLWEHDPYEAFTDGNNIYGVGASDSKGAIATQVYAGYLLKDLNLLKNKNYVVGFTVQEGSATCFGTKFLHEKTMKKKNLPVSLVVIGNSSSLNIYLGQRGRAEFELTIYGRTNHSIIPKLGINAIYKMQPVIKGIEDISDSMILHPMLGESSLAITKVKTLPDIPNVIPDRCYLTIDRRFLHSEPLEDVKAQIQGVIDRIMGDDSTFKATLKLKPEKVCSYTGYTDEVPKVMMPFMTDESSILIQKVYPELKKLREATNFGVWFFNTDGGYTSTILKIPTIGYSAGDEKYYNTPFEKVSIENLMTALVGNIIIHNTMAD